MDVEGPRISYEIEAIKNIMKEKMHHCIRQITMELHLFGPYLDSRKKDANKLRESFLTLKTLESIGFEVADVQISTKYNVQNLNDFLHNLSSKNKVVVALLWLNNYLKFCQF